MKNKTKNLIIKALTASEFIFVIGLPVAILLITSGFFLSQNSTASTHYTEPRSPEEIRMLSEKNIPPLQTHDHIHIQEGSLYPDALTELTTYDTL